MARGASFAKRREGLEQACDFLAGIEEQLVHCQGRDLGPFTMLVDQLAERASAARVAVLAEAVERGEGGPGRHGAHAWLLEWAPSLRAGGSARVVKVVDASRETRYAGLRRAVLEARVPVGNAACVVDEWDRLSHRLHPDAHEAAMDLMLHLAESGKPRDIREVRQRIVAKYGHGGEFQEEQDKLRERDVDVAASGRWWRPVRLPPGRQRRGKGDDRGRSPGALGAAPWGRRTRAPPVAPASDRRPARSGAPRRGLG